MTNEEILQAGKDAFNSEIAGLERVRNLLDSSFVEAANLIFKAKGKVVVTGMGKSGLIAQKIAATLSSTGTLAVFLHPAEGMHGDLGMVSPDDVVIALSKSGVSDEIIGLYPVLKKIGVKTIAIIGNLNSYMAKNSDVVIDASVEEEACAIKLAPTTSTTASLVVGDALAVVLTKMRNFQPQDFALFHPAGRLGKRLILTVGDVMWRGEDLPVCGPDDPMETVLYAITSKGLGCVNIVDNGRLVGLITDGDLRRAIQKNENLLKLYARDIMTPAPRTINASTLAFDALHEMEQGKRQISVLPVTDEAGTLVGTVRVHDLIRAGL